MKEYRRTGHSRAMGATDADGRRTIYEAPDGSQILRTIYGRGGSQRFRCQDETGEEAAGDCLLFPWRPIGVNRAITTSGNQALLVSRLAWGLIKVSQPGGRNYRLRSRRLSRTVDLETPEGLVLASYTDRTAIALGEDLAPAQRSVALHCFGSGLARRTCRIGMLLEGVVEF